MRLPRLLLSCFLIVGFCARHGGAHESDRQDSNAPTPSVVLQGGGWGHGVGMSQYGALGRALAGHSYEQILDFYYHQTELSLLTDFEGFDKTRVPDVVNEFVGVKNSIAISTPLDELGVGQWEVTAVVAGETIGSTSRPLTTFYDGSRWHAQYREKGSEVWIDLCELDPRCENTLLEVVQTIGQRTVVEELEDGPNIADFSGGHYLLQPASVAQEGVLPQNCGEGNQFCVTHSQVIPAKTHHINVLVDVRDRIAISTPREEVGQDNWELSVEAGEQHIGVSTLPLTTYYQNGRWHAQYTNKTTGDITDLCADEPLCENTALKVTQTKGIRSVVEEFEDGPNLGSYTSASYLLQPNSVSLNGSTPDRCGTDDNFCVVVAELDMPQYLYGIAEMSASWHFEAQKAQAVAARSYAASRIVNRARDRSWNDEPFNLYDSINDQVFAGWARASGCNTHKWCAAVDATANEVLTHKSEVTTSEVAQQISQIAQTFYSSSNGGHTAKPTDIWESGADLAYLQSKPDSYDIAYDPSLGRNRNANASWTRTYTVEQLQSWLNNHTEAGEQPLNLVSLQGIDVAQIPASGRIDFASITVSDLDKSVTLTKRGKPYGRWLVQAIRNGCQVVNRCHSPLSSKFTIEWPISTNPPITANLDDQETTDNTNTEPADISFSDVPSGAYYQQAATWASQVRLTNDARPGFFDPDKAISRAEFVEVLWRFDGSVQPTAEVDFEDIPEDATYQPAVRLLSEYNVVKGTTPTTFSPDATLTRAQAAAFLWRFAGRPDEDIEQIFTDVAESAYYNTAVLWMVEHGISTGTSPTLFSPNKTLTRAEVTTFIWRLADRPDAFLPRLPLPPLMRSITTQTTDL